MVGKPVWFTPVAAQKNYTEAIKKFENYKPLYEVDLDKEITFFNNKRTSYDVAAYDLFFSYTKTFPLYDQRKERDNRKYLPDLRERIFHQEEHKAVPATTSLNYGRRVPYDNSPKVHSRKNHIGNFYRRQRVIWGPEEQRYIEDTDKSI